MCARPLQAIYIESISNPLCSVPDVAAVVAFARRHGLVSVVDNTFASPVVLRRARACVCVCVCGDGAGRGGAPVSNRPLWPEPCRNSSASGRRKFIECGQWGASTILSMCQIIAVTKMWRPPNRHGLGVVQQMTGCWRPGGGQMGGGGQGGAGSCRAVPGHN